MSSTLPHLAAQCKAVCALSSTASSLAPSFSAFISTSWSPISAAPTKALSAIVLACVSAVAWLPATPSAPCGTVRWLSPPSAAARSEAKATEVTSALKKLRLGKSPKWPVLIAALLSTAITRSRGYSSASTNEKNPLPEQRSTTVASMPLVITPLPTVPLIPGHWSTPVSPPPASSPPAAPPPARRRSSPLAATLVAAIVRAVEAGGCAGPMVSRSSMASTST
eukprot:scaffold17853_cov60-Phaeocystis_antarctica.AAC.3